MKSFTLVSLLALFAPLAITAALAHPQKEPPIAPAAAELFEKSVRPLLASRCFSCHGETKQFAGLRLDTKAGFLKGSDKGALVMGNDPKQSRLLETVRQTGAVKMPPNGKLSDREIETLEAWVKLGAPWPNSAPKGKSIEERMNEQRRLHWALQPVRRTPLPKVKRNDWIKTPIDKFILADLEKRGISPAPPASRETLIRRATLDVTGLPPRPEEVQAFVADRSPNAYEKLIDRLLASPQYGERWSRQWLDVARYSDTLGYLVGLSGRRYPYAYTYRDYVVRAFNTDKPYDQFVLEQLAADQLDLADKRDLAALGFITVGNRYLGDTQEIMDDRIDVVCRGLQGMTAGCARCHEHKFDPIPTEDYYSLYSVFNNSQEPETLPQIAEPANKTAFAEYQTKLAALEAKMKEAKEKKKDDQADNLRRDILDFKATHPGAPPCAMVLKDNEKPASQKVFIRGSASSLGAEVPRRFLLAIAGDQRKSFEKGSGRLELARAIANPENPLTARVIVNRIWMGHFGKGIVRTPSDFGTRGEPPSHPALLDWLASAFVAKAEAANPYTLGWSLKRLHRLILLSSVYRQSSDGLAATIKADPDNRLLGRMNRRRMDFEQMRDSLLSVAGLLDTTLGGQPVEGVEKSRRRTLYTFLDRQSLPGLLRTFDFPDANQHAPQRSNTTVPQQSLFLLNSPFMLDVAKGLVNRPEVAANTAIRSRVARMASLVYSRPARLDEIEIGAKFLSKMQKAQIVNDAALVSAWQYGYGEYDATSRKLLNFTPLPKFTGSTWQGGDALPDKTLGWVMLQAGGGHPGDAKHAAIRRFVAPRDVTVKVSGEVQHPSPNGNGVLAVVYHSRLGAVASKVAAHGSVSLVANQVTLKKGETLDFIIDCQGDHTSDGFAWSPMIEQDGGAAAPAGAPMQWLASQEFRGPIAALTPVSAWDVYAQALVMTNAFLYID